MRKRKRKKNVRHDKYRTIIVHTNKLFSLFNRMKNEEVITQNMFWSLNETRNALSESLFLHIPNEIILHIFRFFSVPDLCNVSFVCRSFKMTVGLDEI
jgi:hypothetical protein